jgi:hypothetical protein
MNEKKLEDLTTEEFKELKIEFAPGCFDGFEGSQEELAELIAEIKNMITSGEIAEHSRELTEEDFDELPEEVQNQLLRFTEDNNDTSKRNLQ